MRALLLLAASCTLLSCGDPPPPTDGQVEGTLLADSLVAHLDSSLQMTAPYRCARIQEDRATPSFSDMKMSMDGATLKVERLPAKKSLTLAAISDARGSDEATLLAATAMRDIFTDVGVDVVLSLGGHGSKEESLRPLLSAITKDAPYLTLALPGDRESIPAHREIVSELAKSGARIIDGSQYRLLSIGGVLVATMPGIGMRANLVASDEGCLHTAADSRELLDKLKESENNVILASYAPLRGAGSKGSDLGAAGIHIGEKQLAPLQELETLSLFIHGMVGQDSVAKTGKHRLGRGPLSLATGSLDPLDGSSSALIITINGKKLTWQSVKGPPS